jgi:hypothetical protein
MNGKLTPQTPRATAARRLLDGCKDPVVRAWLAKMLRRPQPVSVNGDNGLTNGRKRG